jgi:hypothetical protein
VNFTGDSFLTKKKIQRKKVFSWTSYHKKDLEKLHSPTTPKKEKKKEKPHIKSQNFRAISKLEKKPSVIGV